MTGLNFLSRFGKAEGGVLKITDSFSFDYEGEIGASCIIFSALSSFMGEGEPRIEFSLSVKGEEKPFYRSHSYRIGKDNEYTRQSWRTPPVFLPELSLSVKISLPENTALFIRDFGASFDAPSIEWHGGPRHNAHLGFWGLAPDNTMPAFELAAACGFPSCIVVPKITKDGKIVCIHDDTINRTARDKDGNAPSEPIYVWDKTYAELCEWEYGSYKNQIYKGTKLPLLSDFFDLCKKTGMIPMFSTHPGLTVEQWQEVKTMLEKRGLLKLFHIKSFGIDILKTAYSVFGTEIDGYTYDIGKYDETKIPTLLESGIDASACRVGMEVAFDDYTEEIAGEIRSAGFFAAAWNIKRRDFAEYERLMSYGVTEFTEDNHCSMGLNY